MDIDVVIEVFNRTFQEQCVRLERSEGEPIYYPRDQNFTYDRICFANDFISSALHEVAHWCVAGDARRRLVDYGYWYKPDGRNEQEQIAFQNVEIKPQALEWIFSVAAGVCFNLSLDNLSSSSSLSSESTQKFAAALGVQVADYLNFGLPKRALRFVEALAVQSNTGDSWKEPGTYCR